MTTATQNNASFSSDVTIYSGGTTPGISSEAFHARYTELAVRHVSEQADSINAIAERAFPYYALTYAQEAQIAPLQSKIGRYVDTQIALWVLGEQEISDATFANFENTLTEYGLADFMAFWQNIYNTQCRE